MTTNWMLNTIGLYVTTVGALLMFMYLRGAPRFVDDSLSPEAKRAYAKHQRLVMIGTGLLAAWFVIQYLAVIVL